MQRSNPIENHAGHCALEEQDETLPVDAPFAHGNQATPMGNDGLARVKTAEHQTSKLEIKSQETATILTQNKRSDPREQKKEPSQDPNKLFIAIQNMITSDPWKSPFSLPHF
jgi:hypothetical protein